MLQIIIMIPLSMFILAGFVYTIKTDLRECRNGPEQETNPDEIAAAHRQIAFCDSQLTILRRMEKDAEMAYKTAYNRVQLDTELNQYGAVIPEKIVTRHINQRDLAANKLITARGKVNRLELQKVKAAAVLSK